MRTLAPFSVDSPISRHLRLRTSESLAPVSVSNRMAEWLRACAANGGRAPSDLSEWLPWSMSRQRRRTLTGKA